MKWILGMALLGGALAGCALLAPPPSGAARDTGTAAQRQERPAAPAPTGPPGIEAPAAGPAATVPPQRQFVLSPAAAALIGDAQAQEQSGNFAVAAETLDRALSIEPHNPLVWIELGRESIRAGHPSQAYGMGRKALYLATGDRRAEASAWQLIAASLRAQGRNDGAYTAEERAVALDPN